MPKNAPKKRLDATPERSADTPETDASGAPGATDERKTPREIGGRGGLDPVRYGDWEKDGRCIDF
ncbi:MAG: DUF1674 domain-containing protein [Xanthomonadales bacterium]